MFRCVMLLVTSSLFHLAGFGMVPQHQPFSAMQQQQMYPMAQQGFPTVHQVMMPQPHPGMFMAATQPNQVASNINVATYCFS